jgi:hypothetical protein
MELIYRKADQLIVGMVFKRKSPSADTVALTTELENILNSELKGEASDYGHLSYGDDIVRPGFDIALDQNLELVYTEAQGLKDRRSAIRKLKGLGLTEAEIAAIS